MRNTPRDEEPLHQERTHIRRILVLEAGPFALPEYNQNMPYQGGTPDFRKPWDSHPALAYPGLLFAVGGRSLAWGGWSPQMLAAEISSWPASVAADLVNKYFEISSDQIGATDSNDFIFGRLHDALRLQLFQAMKTAANVPAAMPFATLPDHPAVRYFNQSATLAAAAGAAGGTVSTVPPPPVPPDSQLREWLGFDPRDTTPRADLLNLLKLEAPLAVQARTASGEFPNNKYSAVPTLTKAARIAAGETGGIGTEADARKRLMVVAKCHVLDIITETQTDNWVRDTGVRVQDATGAEQVISLTQPSLDGHQGSVIIALGTIESTRLALSTFKDSLSGRAAQRMGTNLVAHLRSNLTIRIPIAALSSLAPSNRQSLEVSALFVKGKTTITFVGFPLREVSDWLSKSPQWIINRAIHSWRMIYSHRIRDANRLRVHGCLRLTRKSSCRQQAEQQQARIAIRQSCWAGRRLQLSARFENLNHRWRGALPPDGEI